MHSPGLSCTSTVSPPAPTLVGAAGCSALSSCNFRQIKGLASVKIYLVRVFSLRRAHKRLSSRPPACKAHPTMRKHTHSIGAYNGPSACLTHQMSEAGASSRRESNRSGRRASPAAATAREGPSPRPPSSAQGQQHSARTSREDGVSRVHGRMWA